MVSRIDIGPDGGPYVELDEDAGEFIIRVPQENVSFDGADLNSVGTASVGALEAEELSNGVAGDGNTISSISDDAGEYRLVGVVPALPGDTFATTSTDYVEAVTGDDTTTINVASLWTNTNIDTDKFVSVSFRSDNTNEGTIRIGDSPETELTFSESGNLSGPIGRWEQPGSGGSFPLVVELKSSTGNEVAIKRIGIHIWERIA